MLRIKQKYNTAKRLLREKGINFLLVHFFKKYIFRKIFHLVNYLDNKLGFFAIVLFFQEPYFSNGIIAFHDITSDEGVKKFWRTLSSKGLEIISKENPLGIGVLIKKRNEEELESKQFYR
ncbi:MAG: hypothetical protein QXI58_04615 [Candidatus Micrarchaeia archaeon]